MAVEDISKVSDILKKIEELESMYVKVGITSSAGGKMLLIANVNEFGCIIPITNRMRYFFLYNFGFWTNKTVIQIPERSFVRSSFDQKGEEVFTSGDDLINLVICGDLSAKEFYHTLGQTAADTIRNFLINEVKSPANAPLTIVNKGGKTNPLVNTGRLANSINYEIVGG